MASAAKQTWDEIKEQHPSEWLLVVEFETNKCGDITKGVVVGSAKHKSELPKAPTDRGTIALEYTGESTFTGGLRSFADNDLLRH
jgi:hypothetical protein